MTEDEALKAGLGIKSRVLHLDAVPRALVNRYARGLFKIVAEEGSGRGPGRPRLGPPTPTRLSWQACMWSRSEMTVTELADMAPYLTMGETMGEGLKLAAQTFTRDVSRLSSCAA